MGMQVHTTIDEIESAGFTVIPSSEDGFSKLVLHKDGSELWHFNCSDNQLDRSLWFDIGQLSPLSVQKLHWMIRNRICFYCS